MVAEKAIAAQRSMAALMTGKSFAAALAPTQRARGPTQHGFGRNNTAKPDRVFDTESKAEHDKVAAAAQRIKEPAATLLTAVAAYNEALGELREIGTRH